MPFPVGHTLAGCALALAVIPPDTPHALEAWALCLVSANLPDLDFIPGLLTGKPMAFHRGPSHSPVVGVLAAVLGASILVWSAIPWNTRVVLIFLAYGSHVGLDYFAGGRGVLFGWPITHHRSQAARPWFPAVTLGGTRQTFCMSLASRRVLWATCIEMLLLGPGVALLALAHSFALLPLSYLAF